MTIKIISFLHSAWSVCQQRNSLRVTTYTPEDGPCETETCRVVNGLEVGAAEPGTIQRSALKTVFVFKYKI
jgi:hypothetical protein